MLIMSFILLFILLCVSCFMAGYSLKAIRILSKVRFYLKELREELDHLNFVESDSDDEKFEKSKKLILNKGQFEALCRINDLV